VLGVYESRLDIAGWASYDSSIKRDQSDFWFLVLQMRP
jgi:hypothetical protein